MNRVIPLKLCPCGKTPLALNIEGEHDKPKWARCYGECCGEWMVEFRNSYENLGGTESYDRAVEAWNAAPRGEKP